MPQPPVPWRLGKATPQHFSVILAVGEHPLYDIRYITSIGKTFDPSLLVFSPTASFSLGWTEELKGNVGLASALGGVSILCSITIILGLLVVLL